MDYLFDRLKEPSTWRGICAVLTAFGVALDPEDIEVIVSAGLAAVGLLGMLTRDK